MPGTRLAGRVRESQGAAMKLTVNGQELVLDGVDPDTPLLWAIRDMAGLTGTKFGCGQAFPRYPDRTSPA